MKSHKTSPTKGLVGVAIHGLLGASSFMAGVSYRLTSILKRLDVFLVRNLHLNSILSVQRIYCVKGNGGVSVLPCRGKIREVEWLNLEIVAVPFLKIQLLRVQAGWSQPALGHEDLVPIDHLPFVLFQDHSHLDDLDGPSPVILEGQMNGEMPFRSLDRLRCSHAAGHSEIMPIPAPLAPRDPKADAASNGAEEAKEHFERHNGLKFSSPNVKSPPTGAIEKEVEK